MADENAAQPDAQSQGTTSSPGAPETPAAEASPATAAELADLRGKLMRTLADMENLRRRTEREIADTRQYAMADFAREMLSVADNLRRAIAAVPAEPRNGGDKALAALIEGVEVTERGLEQTLAKFGVKRIEAKGQKFDPAIHHAMLEIATDATPPGTVAEEIATGYAIGERVLRPSMVAIAKRLPAASADTANGGIAAAAESPGTTAETETDASHPSDLSGQDASDTPAERGG